MHYTLVTNVLCSVGQILDYVLFHSPNVVIVQDVVGQKSDHGFKFD